LKMNIKLNFEIFSQLFIELIIGSKNHYVP
jgi:hypothetical protein